jgi:cell wall-associated NlpC family hydrolase
MNRTQQFILIGATTGFVFIAVNRLRLLAQLKTVYNKYKGLAYCWGGTDPATGFDCSGFAWYVYNNYLNIPTNRTTAQKMSENSRKVLIPRPGDLIFFKDSTGKIAHVGIYITNNKMLHSGGTSGVSYADFTNSYWAPKVAFIGRLK